MEIKQEYSLQEWQTMFMQGIDLSVLEAKDDLKLFKEYLKEGEVYEHPEKHNDMEIMFFLYKLGYRPEDLGTFFYKEIVKKITYMIPSIIAENDIESLEQLLIELKNKYSQFYFDIAVNEQDTGLKTFHKYIAEARQNKLKADPILEQYIYNGEQLDEDIEPLAIATYLNNITLPQERIYQSYVPQLKHNNNGEYV